MISDRVYVSSSVGALVIGICGNVYGRFSRGGSYTSAVPGLMFLVPVCAPSLPFIVLHPPSPSAQAHSRLPTLPSISPDYLYSLLVFLTRRFVLRETRFAVSVGS